MIPQNVLHFIPAFNIIIAPIITTQLLWLEKLHFLAKKALAEKHKSAKTYFVKIKIF